MRAERTVLIANKRGLHARASAKFVTLASSQPVEVSVARDGQSVTGTSIMGLMMLGAAMGDTITISAEGDGAESAVATLAELVEELRALRLLTRAGAAAGAALAAARAGQHADDLVADLLGVGVEVEQDPRRDSLVLAHEPEQDVLGADVVVAERERLAQGELQHLLGTRRERDLAGGDLLTRADDPNDLRADPFDGDVEGLEDPRGEALLLAEKTKQDVLGADVVVLERPGLLLR